jgi:hypothetical protein
MSPLYNPIAVVGASAPGLCPTLSSVATAYLNGAGAWTTPPKWTVVSADSSGNDVHAPNQAYVTAEIACLALAVSPTANQNMLISLTCPFNTTNGTEWYWVGYTLDDGVNVDAMVLYSTGLKSATIQALVPVTAGAHTVHWTIRAQTNGQTAQTYYQTTSQQAHSFAQYY